MRAGSQISQSVSQSSRQRGMYSCTYACFAPHPDSDHLIRSGQAMTWSGKVLVTSLSRYTLLCCKIRLDRVPIHTTQQDSSSQARDYTTSMTQSIVHTPDLVHRGTVHHYSRDYPPYHPSCSPPPLTPRPASLAPPPHLLHPSESNRPLLPLSSLEVLRSISPDARRSNHRYP